MSDPDRSRVLVVDDDLDVLEPLVELIAMNGYNVDSATNGVDAINLLEGGTRPAVVLVDLLMPGIIGNSVLDYLRENLGDVPAAIITGSPEHAPPGYKVFEKPIDLEGVLAFISEHARPAREGDRDRPGGAGARA
jgi:two-component system, chemotaxis family, chemotaxis protein CheY